MRQRFACLSVDLDGVSHYRNIHGLPASERAAHAAFDVAIPRILELGRAHDVPITFFAIGEDLARVESARLLREALARGHSVESHSHTHPYDLVRSTPGEIRHEVSRSFDAIERAVGRRPRGFRAPGYTLSDAVLDALEEEGAEFDSSVFPSVPYYAAKMAVLGWMALTGRSSKTIIGSPRVLAAPTEAYRPGRSWSSRGQRRLVEIPIRVTRGVRAPVIGTTIGLAGRLGARLLVRACGAPTLFNLELHAMDFLEPADGLADLAPFQPELGVSLTRRLDALEAAIDELSRRGSRFELLDVAARSIAL